MSRIELQGRNVVMIHDDGEELPLHYGVSDSDAARMLPVIKAALDRYVAELPKRAVYMAHVNSAGAVFVKELDYFTAQGGLTQSWGENWVPIVATTLEDARRVACGTLRWAKPYDRQP